jgi:hypothetical protein
MHVIPIKRSCHFGCPLPDGQDAIQHYVICGRMWHQLAKPRGQLSAHLLTRLGLPKLTDPFDGENGIPNSVARLSVATRIYHLTKDDVLPMTYQKRTTAVAAARHALKLPADLSGGAGAP